MKDLFATRNTLIFYKLTYNANCNLNTKVFHMQRCHAK